MPNYPSRTLILLNLRTLLDEAAEPDYTERHDERLFRAGRRTALEDAIDVCEGLMSVVQERA